MDDYINDLLVDLCGYLNRIQRTLKVGAILRGDLVRLEPTIWSPSVKAIRCLTERKTLG